MSTLYLVQQGTTLRKEHYRFLIEPQNGEETEIPVREVEQVLVFGNIHLTTSAISTCLSAQIPVVFLSHSGSYKGHLWSAELCSLDVEAAQFARRDDSTFRLSMAQSMMVGKLMNSRQLLMRLNRKRELQSVSEAIAGIALDIAAAQTTDNLDSLRGYEGVAAARYFPALGQLLVNPNWQFSLRTRRPPTDPINSMLSFGYTLLFNNVLSLLLTEGLNPYLGNRMGLNGRRPIWPLI